MLRLLRLLADGGFHSGEVLGRVLGVSRSAVWKQLQLLEIELGVEIHKVRGRGYRLARPVSLLDAEQLMQRLQVLGWSVRVLDSVDSTNAEAARLIGSGHGMPALVLAERQTAGRGRRGRTWVSPFAENLYYSLVLRIDGGLQQLEGLSLVVGLSVMRALHDAGVSRAGLKWPNDVLVDGRKIAGILLELMGDPADVCHLVIGVGINVNMQVSDEVDQAWTSASLQVGGLIERNDLVVSLSEKLNRYLALHREHGFTAIQSEWEQNHLWQGRAVSLHAGSGVIEGKVLGIDAVGALRLEVAGVEERFSGGELSLRLRDDS
jgi:BirA family biotin operon repressor/biotin-[acetyl-CoA-carboxylase] ligase